MSDPIALLRSELSKQRLDGFILPVNDEFMGEYVPASARRLEWLTGFTGSAGMAVITQNHAAFFTDGRYTLQAKAQVKGFEHFNSGDLSPEKWISLQMENGNVIGYDPRLHTLLSIRRYEKAASRIAWQAITPNPIDMLWKNRPAAPASEARLQPLRYSGETSSAKRKLIAARIAEKNADVLIMTAPDSICWLLNLRGNDVPYTPFLLCNAMLDVSGNIVFYMDKQRIPEGVLSELDGGILFKPPQALEPDLKALHGKRVMYDPAGSSIWFYQQLKNAGADIIEATDPCMLPKACKNDAELEGMRQAHIRDGLAVTRFLYWLDNAVAKGEKLTEISVAEKLESFRKISALYLEPSFSTIAGSGPNGAIVHYHATKETSREIERNTLLLLDSGGQYPDGTTDITRTVAIGEPTAEMKKHFTLVLKGHIALARALFPEGTSGSQLDALARQFLWKEGLDYDHGTGHGVGSHLSVHEGPQRISKRGGDAVLLPGMVVSNEPGYYRAGHYGIRIESLVAVKVVKEQDNKRYFGFETITLAPLDMRLVEKRLLTQEEEKWLQEYHKRVYENHISNLTNEEAVWLQQYGVVR